MKKITVQAQPGRSVPLSVSCHRPDNGPRVLTADQGAVVLELRDVVAVGYIRGRERRGDLVTVPPAPTAPAATATPAPTGRKD